MTVMAGINAVLAINGSKREGGNRKMESKIVRVTPELAKIWLESSAGNRNISYNTVEMYAADMKAGRWFENGESIKFDSNGALRDGHHRLEAIIKAGVPVNMIVVYGINPKECNGIDLGRGRTYRDSIAIAGAEPWKKDTTVIATARLYFCHIERIQKPSLSEVTDFTDEHEKALRFCYEKHKRGAAESLVYTRKAGVFLAVMATLEHYGFDERTKFELEKFLTQLNSGVIEDVNKNSVVILRNGMVAGLYDVPKAMVRNQEILYATENAIRDYLECRPRTRFYRNCKAVYTGQYFKKQRGAR